MKIRRKTALIAAIAIFLSVVAAYGQTVGAVGTIYDVLDFGAIAVFETRDGAVNFVRGADSYARRDYDTLERVRQEEYDNGYDDQIMFVDGGTKAKLLSLSYSNRVS